DFEMTKWNFIVVLLAVLFYCYKSPFFRLVDPLSYSVSLPEKFEGALKPNEKLDKTERMHENEIHWPESLAVHQGVVYTGLGDGRIVRITPDKVTEICRTGKECAGQHEEHICGRPLGMKFNKAGLLYVVDGYLGLFTVDVKTGEKNIILPSDTLVMGKPLTLLNDLALDEKKNVIYLTQSSTKWNLSQVIVSIVEHDTSGRLLEYDLKTKVVTVLLKDLSFPNGVEFTHDGSALLIAEGNKNKIFKYIVTGPKKGFVVDLSLVLPGEPDNISRNKRGNYWVGLSTARTAESPGFHDRFSEYPFLRRVFLHVHKISTTPISFLLSLLPYKQAKEIAFELQNGRIVADLPIGYGMIIEFDDNGKIIQSLHSPSGKVVHISEVLEH
ncbi:Adipocyte plasma membrane-associated protein, partial [Stegodyphus mimosarum]